MYKAPSFGGLTIWNPSVLIIPMKGKGIIMGLHDEVLEVALPI